MYLSPLETLRSLGLSVQGLLEVRAEVRRAVASPAHPAPAGGACGAVSEAVQRRFRVVARRGCYLHSDGRHVPHAWNALPDGRILDVCADRFDATTQVRFATADHPRYLSGCTCSADDVGNASPVG